MTYETYKGRYLRAYEKLAAKINLMDGGYSEDEIHEAYDIYMNYSLWYCRAFKPSALASTNVLFYEYQIRGALEWSGYYLTDDELHERVQENPEGLASLVRRWAKATGMKQGD